LERKLLAGLALNNLDMFEFNNKPIKIPANSLESIKAAMELEEQYKVAPAESQIGVSNTEIKKARVGFEELVKPGNSLEQKFEATFKNDSDATKLGNLQKQLIHREHMTDEFVNKPETEISSNYKKFLEEKGEKPSEWDEGQ
jgi:hypothetical protein